MNELSVGPLKIKYMGESHTRAVPISGGDPIVATQHLALITGPSHSVLKLCSLSRMYFRK